MKTKILMSILLIIMNIMIFNVNIVHAEGISDIITGGDSFLEAGKNGNAAIDETKLQSTSTMIYNVLLILGICVAVIISSVLGIKFMIGSAEEKAQIKDALIPFIIGCIIVFGAFGIWKIFVNIGNNVSSVQGAYEKADTKDKSDTKGGSFHKSSSGSSHGGGGF